VFHPLQYLFGYDDNRFMDKPYFSNDGLTLKSYGFVIEGTIYVAI
jgi:hypothetical protein